MTEGKNGRPHLSVVPDKTEKPLFVSPVTKRTIETAVDVVTFSLLKGWFPKSTPQDIAEWTRIAKADAEIIVKALADENFLSLEETD
jgi:hypothetical protein